MAARLLLALVAAFATVPSATAGALEGGSCGGLAPLVFECTTGPLQGPFRIVLDLDPGFTGGVASVIVHPAGERVFRCEYFAGTLTGCNGSGTFPAPGAPATHQCRTYFYETPVPGGLGRWQCTLEQP